MSENLPSQPEDFLYGLALSGGSDNFENLSLLAARATGLYQSENGQDWRLATESLDFTQAYSATAVASAVNANQKSTIFLGLAGGLLFSSNGGQTWSMGSLPQPPPVVSCLAISPDFSRDGIILAGTLEDGVLRSSDNGRRWVLWNFGLLDLGVMSLAISPRFSQDETVFAGTESGLFRSTNGGRAWREVEMPCDYDPVMCLALPSEFNHEKVERNSVIDQVAEGIFRGTIFVGTESQGLFRSMDWGKSWQRLGSGIIDDTVQMILLSPVFNVSPSLLAVAGGRVYFSSDAGLTWMEIWSDVTAQKPAVSVLAPEGMEPGKSAWVGLVDGEVKRMEFPG